MANRNVDKGREAENAVADVFRRAGCVHCERRSKRGGTVTLPCRCRGMDEAPGCDHVSGRTVPADAGDLTGIPGVVVQVKWSPYRPLAQDLARTDEQRQVAGADVGLLVRKRNGVGCVRATEWDAYLPQWQLAILLGVPAEDALELPDATATWHADLGTAARLICHAGYGTDLRGEQDT